MFRSNIYNLHHTDRGLTPRKSVQGSIFPDEYVAVLPSVLSMSTVCGRRHRLRHIEYHSITLAHCVMHRSRSPRELLGRSRDLRPSLASSLKLFRVNFRHFTPMVYSCFRRHVFPLLESVFGREILELSVRL